LPPTTTSSSITTGTLPTGSSVVITASTPIYDIVRGQIYKREIPYGAVVVPGSRPMRGAFAEEHGLSIAAPMIVKYRDEKTDASTALEDALR
jgi:2,3,4,5-tetrahydropyridine-2,6-dicarboxylate N-succinyltransferase